MADTKIQWCDHTFNPWEGCTKVSPGCANCYAESRNHRFGLDNWGKGKPRRLTSDANWKQPLKWNEFPYICESCGRGWSNPGPCFETIAHEPCGGKTHRARVFCASLADWLDDEVPIEWLARLLKLIHDTPNLDWLNLTKRPENFFLRLGLAVPPSNVWIGASVEDQKRADERIPLLLQIPARVRFLSAEPMLEAIDLKLPAFKALGRERVLTGYEPAGETTVKIGEQIHWVIFGGESGRNARPCNVAWIRDGVRQCKAAGVKVFVKQLGAKPYSNFGGWEGHEVPLRLKYRKGGDWSEWPEDLRVREFPL